MQAYILVPVLAAAATLAGLLLLVPWLAARLGLVGVDVHKPWRPRVPETGGSALALGMVSGLAAAYLATGSEALLGAALAVAGAWAVGFIDDLVRLDAVSKPLLSAAPATALIAFGAYTPVLVLPLVGEFRLSLVYPALVIALVTVSANMFNMIDVLNGSMVLTALTVLAFTGLSAAVVGTVDDASLLAWLAVASALAAYAPFNVYPARVFNGDSGSLATGTALAAVALLLRSEAFFVIASLPLVLNGFQILASAGGLRERSEMPRPTRLRGDCIEASRDPNAPLTLVQLVVLRRCLREPEVVAYVAMLALFSGVLAVLTALAHRALLAPG